MNMSIVVEQAGGWSMTQKSPTNEDASEVIVI